MQKLTEETFDYKKLDDIIHSKIRLGIISVLVKTEVVDFVSLKKVLKTSDGNLSTHLKKLEDAKYIKVSKSFVDNKPKTTYQITKQGFNAFKNYVNQLQKVIEI